MAAKQPPARNARALAIRQATLTLSAFRAQRRARAELLKGEATDLVVRRANHRVWWSASLLVQTVDLLRPALGPAISKEMLADVTGLPPAKLCECGCSNFVMFSATGRPPRFASAACRKRAYRRRHAGLPEDAPKTKPGGRWSLAARLQEWVFWRAQSAYLLVHETQLVRDAMRRRGLTRAQMRNHLRWRRIEAGLRPSPLANIMSSRYSTRSIQL